jgi:glucose/arabinose dehydrogenase
MRSTRGTGGRADRQGGAMTSAVPVRPSRTSRASFGLLGLAVALAACTAPPVEPPPDRDPPAASPSGPEPAPTGPDDGPTGPAAGLPDVTVVLPPLVLVEVADLDAPLDTTVLADGTVLVAERAGIVRVLLGAEPGRVVLDVSGRTTTDGERGLLSIAAAPWGDELFVSMTDARGDTLVEAYPLSGAAVTGPPRTIFALAQPRANHNGGPLVFLPDGTLLLGLGDGGGQRDPLGAGQDLGTPLGAILRLEVRDGGVRIPADNPFVGRDGAAEEIAFLGLRNPWRISYDPERDELWIADVGGSRREEINRVRPSEQLGANLGWALREGGLELLGPEPEGHVPPLHEYAHGPGCSVTGGLVYRGRAIPELVGAYVFSDLCDSELRVLLTDGTSVVARPLGVSGERVVGFGTDADGELLVLEIGGRVLRLARG